MRGGGDVPASQDEADVAAPVDASTVVDEEVTTGAVANGEVCPPEVIVPSNVTLPEVPHEQAEQTVSEPVELPQLLPSPELSEEDREVLQKLAEATEVERVLFEAARIPAINDLQDIHLKISNADRSDASLAARALARLAEVCQGDADTETVMSDRRFEQILECVWCHAERLTVEDAANVYFGLSKLRCQELALLEAMIENVADRLSRDPTVNASHAVTIAWSLAHASALLGFSSNSCGVLLRAVTAKLLQEWDALTPAEVAKLAWAQALQGRHLHDQHLVVKAVGDTAVQRAKDFAPKDLTVLAWALSSLGYRNGTVRDAVVSGCVGRLAELSVEELGLIARALAVWGPGEGQGADVIMLELLVCAEAKRADLGPNQVADVLWAFASGGWRNASAFLTRELAGVAQNLGDYPAVSLVKVLWAYATLLPPGSADDVIGGTGQRHSHLLSAVTGRAAVMLFEASEELPPAFLVRAAWALATLGHYEADLFSQIARGLEKRIGELELADVADVAWAFARVKHPRNSLFDQLALLLELRHGDFSPRELGQCLWALASCGYKLRLQSELLLEESQLRELKPSDTAKLLWSLAKLGPPYNEDLLRAVGRDLKPKLATFSPEDLANSAWALATIGWAGEKVMEYVANAALRWMEFMNPIQVATLVHSLVRVRHPPDGLIEPLQLEVERRIRALLESGVSPEGRFVSEDLFSLGRCQQLFLTWRREQKQR